MKKVNSCPR